MQKLIDCEIATNIGRFALTSAFEAIRPWNMRLVYTSERYISGRPPVGAPDVLVINLHGWNPPSAPSGKPIPWERISLKLADYPDYAFKGDDLIERCNQTLVQINQWSTDRELFATIRNSVSDERLVGLQTARGFIPERAIQTFTTVTAQHFGLI